MRLADAVTAFAVIVLAPCLAAAQAGVLRAEPVIASFPDPPAGFDPLTASAADLATYGFPPRPNRLGRNAAIYATWARAMSAAKIHVMPQVRMTNRRHGPALLANKALVQSVSYQNSYNWSGQALTTGAGSFGSNSFAEAAGEWILSAEQQAVGTCNGTDVASTWVGLDGLGSSDVLQAGTEGDVACSNGVTTQNYYPWFEWYPDYEYEITNFLEFRGATVFVVVHATSATSGTAMFVNLQTNAYTNVSISPPSGTSLKGNSAEWIVERPTIGNPGALGTLADFGMYGINAEVAYTQSGLQNNVADFAGTPGANQVSVLLTMVNASNTILASPSPAGGAAQFVFPEGPTL